MHRSLFPALLFLGTLLVAEPAMAQQITKLVVRSPSGDYIGQGLSYTLTPADGVFNATSNFNNGVTFTLHNADYSMWWQIDFAAINHALLTVGAYANAIRFPAFDATHNQLQVSTAGRGCNTLTGTYQIRELTWTSPTQVRSFWVTLEQSCEGFMPPLNIELMYHMEASTPVRDTSWGSLKTHYR